MGGWIDIAIRKEIKMKNFAKKLLSVTIAVMMVISMGAVAFADTAEPSAPADGEVARPIADGEYTIEAETGEKMFKVVNAVLTVKDGKMTALVTLSATGYTYLYAGTVTTEDTLDTVAEADRIPVKNIVTTEDDKKQAQYEVPVASLDEPLPFGSFSERKNYWYARTITFKADTLKPCEPPKEEDKPNVDDKDDPIVTNPDDNTKPDVDKKPVDNNTDAKDNNVPVTADNTNMAMMLLVMASAFGASALLYKKRSNM